MGRVRFVVGAESASIQSILRAAVACACYFQMDASCASSGGVQVQDPGTHLEIGGGISNIFANRDLLLSEKASANVFGAAARNGFAASLWVTKPSAAPGSYEALLSYSYKLSAFDLHLGFVKSNITVQPMLSGEFLRIALTNNLSTATLFSLTVDTPIHTGPKGLSISLAHEFGVWNDFRFAVRGGASIWHFDTGSTRGQSIHLYALRPLTADTFLNVHIAAVRSDVIGSPDPRSAGEIGFGLTRRF